MSLLKKDSVLHRMYSSRVFRWNLLGFALFITVLYGWMYTGRGIVPFQLYNYEENSHHFETRTNPEDSNDLLYNLSTYDANFYLTIAAHGYADHPKFSIGNEAPKSQTIGILSYAFAPGYPMLVGLVNIFVHNIYVSAFIITIVLALLCFITIWWLIYKWYDEKLALKSTWLILLLPSAFFLYTYFTEALTIILLALILNAYREKSLVSIAVLTGVISITRFSMLVLIPVFAGWLIYEYLQKRIIVRKAMLSFVVSLLPLIAWIAFCWLRDGNPLIFLAVRTYWGAHAGDFFISLFNFFLLSFHDFHSSQVDTASIVISGVLLALSYKWLPRVWWIITISIWGFAVVATDTMSGFRYQLVLIPLYFWLASRLKTSLYIAFMIVSVTLLFTISILGINYWWIG